MGALTIRRLPQDPCEVSLARTLSGSLLLGRKPEVVREDCTNHMGLLRGLSASNGAASLGRGVKQLTVRAASTSVNSQQHGDVLPHFREQRCLGFGMKLCLTACPVQAFKLVEQDSTFHLIDFAGQREGIWFGTEHPVTVRAQQEVLAACFAGWT